ncbi:MAG: hypothetical protein WKG07_29605 [Hymenobacter sp.]
MLITQTLPVGNSRVQVERPRRPERGGELGYSALTLTFQNGISPIAPVNLPLWDDEDNVGGFRIQNVRPGTSSTTCCTGTCL